MRSSRGRKVSVLMDVGCLLADERVCASRTQGSDDGGEKGWCKRIGTVFRGCRTSGDGCGEFWVREREQQRPMAE